MTDWVWDNHKKMLHSVLDTKNDRIIAENSILAIPRLIEEIEDLRAEVGGGAGACVRKPGEYESDSVNYELTTF